MGIVFILGGTLATMLCVYKVRFTDILFEVYCYFKGALAVIHFSDTAIIHYLTVI